MKKITGKRSGFTIIEVSLVLAIAGLIFMMVFIALPSLQRNQRDAKRREDMIIYTEAISKYQSNNRGALPSGTPASVTADSTDNEWGEFYQKYLPSPFTDPSGQDYSLKVVSCEGDVGAVCNGGTLEQGVILTIIQAACNGENAIKTANPRKIAVRYKLEGGGVYCGDN